MSKQTTYKGFDEDLKCRGFQYEINKEYKHDGNVESCVSGFHSCENPFDVWDYYPLGSNNRYAEVEIDGIIHEGNSKIASEIIKIKTELTLKSFIESCIKFILEKSKVNDKSAISNDEDSAKIGSSGDYAQIGSSGYSAKIGSSGEYAQIGSSGNYAQIGSSGNSAKIGSSGDYAQIGSSGYSAKIGSSGEYAQIGSSGDYAQIESSGNDAVISAIGKHSRIKGKKGSWITLAEYDDDGKCIIVISKIIDGKKLKEDVFYTIKNKKIIEITL